MNTPLLLFLTWLLPGLGHIAIRKKFRAIAYMAIIFILIILGVFLEGRLYVPASGDIISFLAAIGQLGSGLFYIIIGLMFGYRGRPEAPGADYGTLFILTAGLMNLLLILEIYNRSKGNSGD